MMAALGLIVALLITVTMALPAVVFTVHAIDMLHWAIVVMTGFTVTLQIPAIGSVMIAMPMSLAMLVVMATFKAV